MSLLSGLVPGLGAESPVTISGFGLGRRTEGGSSWRPVALPAAGTGIRCIDSSASDMGSLWLDSGEHTTPLCNEGPFGGKEFSLADRGTGMRRDKLVLPKYNPWSFCLHSLCAHYAHPPPNTHTHTHTHTPDSSIHGDSPGTILEWVGMPSSKEIFPT